MRLWASISTTRPRFPFATFVIVRGPGMIKSRDLEGPKGIVEPRMKNLIEVSVDSIRIHMPTAQHLVILKEKEADRYLPIWIGSFQAPATKAKNAGKTPRPPPPPHPLATPLAPPPTRALRAPPCGALGISIKQFVGTPLAAQFFSPRLYVKQDGRDL